ncbi:MAG: hypothetical protein PHR69_06875 [Sphaerochaeta sp.]|nr:hypothetical protein [Sphaerochaeta sp.]
MQLSHYRPFIHGYAEKVPQGRVLRAEMMSFGCHKSEDCGKELIRIPAKCGAMIKRKNKPDA